MGLRAESIAHSSSPAAAGRASHKVSFSFCGTNLTGWVSVPHGARGLVIFVDSDAWAQLDAHWNPLADLFDAARFATLLVDLVQPDERQHPPNGLDPRFFTNRLIAVTDRVRGRAGLERLPVGYLATGIGASAALWTASLLQREVGAVVALGWVPEGTEPYLTLLRAPTLFMVREDDRRLLAERDRFKALRCAIFEVVREVSAGEQECGSPPGVGPSARDWFLRHLTDHEPPPPSWVVGKT